MSSRGYERDAYERDGGRRSDHYSSSQHYSSRDSAAAFSSSAAAAGQSHRSAPAHAHASSASSRHYRSPSPRGSPYRSHGGGGHRSRSRSRSARSRRHGDSRYDGGGGGSGGGGGGGGSSQHYSSSSHAAVSSHHHATPSGVSRHARHSSRSASRSSSRSGDGSDDDDDASLGSRPSHRSIDRSSGGDDAGSNSDDEADEDDDDKEGLIDIQTGELILNRYEVLSVAGQGTFGTVLDVYDTHTSSRLALKVVRSVPRYLEAAQVEVDILSKIARADPQGKSLCVRFVKQFRISHRGHEHECIGFEKLGRSLYDFLKKNNYRGFSLANVARFGFQLLTAVAFCHSMRLIHTDLKPENILLRHSDYRIVKNYSRYKEEREAKERDAHARKRAAAAAAAASSSSSNGHHSSSARNHASSSAAANDSSSDDDHDSVHASKTDIAYREPLSTAIRLIDFGGATFEEDHHSRIVNTRQYRAPEVLLGLGWSYPSDLWSIGCILPELFTGELLFATHEDLEHMALMEKILGRPLPDSITRPAVEPYLSAAGASSSSSSSSSWRALTRRGEPESESERSEASESTDRSKRSHSHKRERSSSAPRADLLLHLSTGRLRWPEGARSANSVKTVERARTLQQLLPDPDFLDLIQQLLTYDPSKRITAKQALQHPFFRHVRHEFEQSSNNVSASAPPTPSSYAHAQSAAASSSSASSAAQRDRDRDRGRERERERERDRDYDRRERHSSSHASGGDFGSAYKRRYDDSSRDERDDERERDDRHRDHASSRRHYEHDDKRRR